MVNGVTTIASVAGVNPVDTTAIELKNIRGVVKVTLTAADDPIGLQASFVVKGGYGEWPDDYTWTWYVEAPDSPTSKWCTVTTVTANVFEVTTIAPLVVRTYTMTFNPRIPYPPTIQLFSGTLLGVNDLVVDLEKLNRRF